MYFRTEKYEDELERTKTNANNTIAKLTKENNDMKIEKEKIKFKYEQKRRKNEQ